MRPGAELPDRCVKTNLPADGQWVDLSLSWHHPAVYLVILANLILYLIVSHFVSKRVVVRLGITEEEVLRRRRDLKIVWGMIAVGAVLSAAALVRPSLEFLVVPGLLMMLATIPLYLMRVRIVWATKMDDGFVWLAGVNSEYLDSLPDWDSR